MFAQDYDIPDDASEGELEAEAGNESSDDDDLKRVLRHIGGIGENAAQKEDDFEQSMEDELDATVKSLEKNRTPQPAPVLSVQDSSSNNTHHNTDFLKDQDFVTSSIFPPNSSKDPTASTSSSKAKKNVQFTDKAAEFYDDAYFDSDDEEPGIGTKLGSAAGSKKHPVLSNDELFYDPKEDDEDQRWVDEQRRRYKPRSRNLDENIPSTSSPISPPKKKKTKEQPEPTTDAVLNCPACMSTVCLDCQRHEIYHQQYRAMFVLNCTVDTTRTLICKAKKQSSKKRRTTESAPDEFVPLDDTTSSTTSKEDTFHPVKCVECGTEVGVIDNEEVYHFFNVIASHP